MTRPIQLTAETAAALLALVPAKPITTTTTRKEKATTTTTTASAEDWTPPASPPNEAQKARMLTQCMDVRFVEHVGTEGEWKKFISALAHIPDDGTGWARKLAHDVSKRAAGYVDAADVDHELDRAAGRPGAWPALLNVLDDEVGPPPWTAPAVAPASGGARILLVDDMLAAKAAPYIVKSVIPQGSVGVIYGMPNAGKSFLSWLIAGAIAQGEPVLGCRSRQSPVLVVSYEGHGGLRQRVAAHRAEGIFPPGVGIAFSASAPLLKNDAGGNHIITDIHATEKMTGMAHGIVFVDTLAASIGGGNENAEGMAEALSQARRIRTETGWAVAFLHHVGKDVSKGPRGGSGLMGDADFALEVEAAATAGDVRTATLVKSRDSVAGRVWGFKLKVVDLGTDDDGEVITSCVAYTTDVPATVDTATPSAARCVEPRGSWQRAVWRAAHDLADLAFDDDAELPAELVLREALNHVTAVPDKRDRRLEYLARALDGMAGQGGVWAKGGTVYVRR